MNENSNAFNTQDEMFLVFIKKVFSNLDSNEGVNGVY